jgi:hypothetical protein
VWKLLTEHICHQLTVMAEEDPNYDRLVPGDVYFVEPDSAEYVDADDITMSAYVDGWPERPTLPNWSGLLVEAGACIGKSRSACNYQPRRVRSDRSAAGRILDAPPVERQVDVSGYDRLMSVVTARGDA